MGSMTDMNNNVNIAILTKVNELASRYRLEPYDFLATLTYEKAPNPRLDGKLDHTGRSKLLFDSTPQEPSKLERYELMLETIGVSNETGLLVGTDEEIFKALNRGLELAPRARPRS